MYYDEEATRSFKEATTGEYDGIGAVMSQNRDTGVITISQVYETAPRKIQTTGYYSYGQQRSKGAAKRPF